MPDISQVVHSSEDQWEVREKFRILKYSNYLDFAPLHTNHFLNACRVPLNSSSSDVPLIATNFNQNSRSFNENFMQIKKLKASNSGTGRRFYKTILFTLFPTRRRRGGLILSSQIGDNEDLYFTECKRASRLYWKTHRHLLREGIAFEIEGSRELPLQDKSEFKLIPLEAHKQHIKTLFATKPVDEMKEFVVAVVFDLKGFK